MVTWRDYAVKQEQYQDRLRQAEQRRLVSQLAGGQESAIWQAIKKLGLGTIERRPTRGQVLWRSQLALQSK